MGALAWFFHAEQADRHVSADLRGYKTNADHTSLSPVFHSNTGWSRPNGQTDRRTVDTPHHERRDREALLVEEAWVPTSCLSPAWKGDSSLKEPHTPNRLTLQKR